MTPHRRTSPVALSEAAELQDLVTFVLQRPLAPFHSVLARAVERGESLPEQRDLAAQPVLFGVLMWNHTHIDPLSDGYCDKVAQLLLPRTADR